MKKKAPLKFPVAPGSIEEAFDFSVPYVTADEVSRIRSALEAGSLLVPLHGTNAAVDDALTLQQILNVVAVGVPTSKDLLTSKTRQAGVNFEGRAGGSRKIRVKVSWQESYYVVTVHSILKIKRKR